MYIRSVLIKDTTKEEREDIIRKSLDCGGGCENCSSCWLGGAMLCRTDCTDHRYGCVSP